MNEGGSPGSVGGEWLKLKSGGRRKTVKRAECELCQCPHGSPRPHTECEHFQLGSK